MFSCRQISLSPRTQIHTAVVKTDDDGYVQSGICLKELEMNYYHLCTEGLSETVMFRDNEDYVTGINYLAVCQIALNQTALNQTALNQIAPNQIEIIAFCLMSNHLHIVAKGENAILKKFIISFKRRYSMWLARKYNEHKILHRTAFTIKEIGSTEYLKQVIAYVLRNPIAAGINVSPFQYKWSSASCYFRLKDETFPQKNGTFRQKNEALPQKDETFRRQDETFLQKNEALPQKNGTFRQKDIGGKKDQTGLTGNKIRRIFKTRTLIFDGINIIEGEMADLTSFVKFTEVEAIFKTSRTLMYFMSKDNDNEIELEMNTLKKVSYNDSTVINAIRQICEKKFQTSQINALGIHEKCSLVKYMKKNFNSSPKQIARILSLRLQTIAQIY